ncbi:hypothetical protein AAVH_27148, partial [Aphelenchoides avenae]
LITICEDLDCKFPRFDNNYGACAFIAVIQALASIGKYFVEALRRRVNEATGGAIHAGNAPFERRICWELIRMLEKDAGDYWRRTIYFVKKMDAFRQLFANVQGADPALSENRGIDPYKVFDAIINLLRADDQRHFKVVTKKAFRCPHSECRA